MIQSIKFHVLLLSLLLPIVPVSAQATPILIAVDSACTPYMYGSNPTTGIYPEIIRAAFRVSGISVTITGYPWKRALILGRDGAAGVGGIYQNIERLKVFDFSDPLYTETLLICVRKGRRFAFKAIVDLKGKRVGINRGWSYGEVFDNARRSGLFVAEEAANNRSNLKNCCRIAWIVSLSINCPWRGSWGRKAGRTAWKCSIRLLRSTARTWFSPSR